MWPLTRKFDDRCTRWSIIEMFLWYSHFVSTLLIVIMYHVEPGSFGVNEMDSGDGTWWIIFKIECDERRFTGKRISNNFLVHMTYVFPKLPKHQVRSCHFVILFSISLIVIVIMCHLCPNHLKSYFGLFIKSPNNTISLLLCRYSW
jgi:hypothetical protein